MRTKITHLCWPLSGHASSAATASTSPVALRQPRPLDPQVPTTIITVLRWLSFLELELGWDRQLREAELQDFTAGAKSTPFFSLFSSSRLSSPLSHGNGR